MNKPQNREYLKYRDRFKLYGLLSIVASAVMIVTIITILFVPIFEINLLIAKEWFSVLDEVKFLIKEKLYGHLYFIVIGALILLANIILAVIFIVKTFLQLSNAPDDYALQNYDTIIRIRSKDTQSARTGLNHTPFALFITGLAILILGIVFDAADKATTYFSLCTGVDGLIAILILFFLGYIVFIAVANTVLGKIKTEIIRSEYDVQGQQAVFEPDGTPTDNSQN